MTHCVVHIPKPPMERMWLNQRQHQVTLGSREATGLSSSWGALAQAQLPVGLQLLEDNTTWEGSQKCAQLLWHPLCCSHTGNQTPPVVPSQESTWPCLFPFSLPAQKSLFLSARDNCLASNSSLGSRESIVSNSHQAGSRSKRE